MAHPSKRVLISGAAGALGKAVVSRFLTEGYQVAAVLENQEQITAIGSHDQLQHFVADLRHEHQAQQLVEQMMRHDADLDAALLLVGGFAPGTLEHTDSALLRRMIALNFETAFHLTRLLFPFLLQQGYGQLVFVGARPALEPSAAKHAVAYALSKSLLLSFAEILNEYGKGTEVTATVIVPSIIDTPANRSSMPEASFERWVKPEQIADLLLMICSPVGRPLRQPVYKIYGMA